MDTTETSDHHIRISRAFATLVRLIVRNTGCDPLFFTTPIGVTHCFLQHLEFHQNPTDYMEAKAANSILDFETLFSDFQELLNGSSLKDVCFLFCDSFVCISAYGGVFTSKVHFGSAVRFGRDSANYLITAHHL